MPKRAATVVVDEPEFDPEDPRIAGKDPSMIPGHPQCNYEKYLAAQPKVDIVMQGDPENRHITTFHLGLGTYRSPEYPFGQTVYVPWPLAVNAMMTGRCSTSNAELRDSLRGQIRNPLHPDPDQPLPGPWSGDTLGKF